MCVVRVGVGVESDGRRDGIVGLFVCPVAGKPRPQVFAEGDNGREEGRRWCREVHVER